MCGEKPCEKKSCTWSETFRRECEAREVMRWEREKRQGYYADVKKRRGEKALQSLVDEVNRQWGIRNTRK